MNLDIKNIIGQMLKMDIQKKHILSSQLDNLQYDIEKEGNLYNIKFKGSCDLEKNMNGCIRMDTYLGLHEIFVFELVIKNGSFHTLKIHKHSEKTELAFDVEDISLNDSLLSYDISFFKDLSYLPIGTVVSLEKGWKKMMIYGRDVKHASENKVYKYIGCFYPDGIRDFNRIFLFDSIQITKVHSLGMQGIEENQILSMMK